jgi:ribonucleoside-diphosphate reductase beta chain
MEMGGTLDTGDQSYRYYRNAVERHWDPHEIDIGQDLGPLETVDEATFDQLRAALALFGAGEEAVTEDLAPLATVLDDVPDQLFVTTQLYEEAKHTDFFDRYWEEVINPVEDARGMARSDPSADHWFVDEYYELFDRNERAMHRLLDEDTPENRAIAYCHYHLTVEGILAQTGYYAVQSTFDGSVEDVPELTGLVEGFKLIRGDEGRHVGFGMRQLKSLVESEQVSPSLLHETVDELVVLIQAIVTQASSEDGSGATSSDLVSYAASHHTRRMKQIVEASEEIPSVDDLVALSDG